MINIPINKTFRSSQLIAEMKTAGLLPKIITIRTPITDDNGLGSSGEVICVDDVNVPDVQAVINAHVPQDTNDQKIRAAAITAAITKLQNASCTNAEAQGILAKVLKYLRNEAI